jgi:hypothetical protein
MLVRSRVVLALEAKKDRFDDYQLVLRDHISRYQQALERLASLRRAEIEARLAEAGREWPGARPTAEHDQVHDAVVSFDQDWSTHEAARAWARQTLLGQPTFAVDGSQIPPSPDFSVPVAAIQVAWFENPHAPGGQYVKDLIFDVLAPEELSGTPEQAAPENQAAGSGFPDTQVNLRRFEMECRILADYIRAHADQQPAPLCFLDGSLVVSFVRHMSPELRRAYVAVVTGLMRASRECRVPLVGYVDTSYAHDLLAMLGGIFGLTHATHLNDGSLLRPHMQWGERSQVYQCARDDKVLPLYDADTRDMCFAYLKTTGTGNPARVEFPGWLAGDGAELERVLNVVRAECVVGNGYPYALETADAAAVISLEDRRRFYATFQQFAERQGLALRYSRKALSKQTRR